MRRLALFLAAVVLSAPSLARGAFHLSLIDEVMSGFDGDPSVQYVEIRMLGSGQSSVGKTRLTVFHCDGSAPTVLLVVPKNVTNSGPNSRWLMATPKFAEVACLQPDFVFQPGISSCGQICWGAPGSSFPPDPGTWDATVPDNYVDCVAYGGYAGTTRTGSGTPVPSGPGDGQTQALTRLDTTGNNAADFALADPGPVNNAGLPGHFGAVCPTTTTTSTTVSTASSTTTTLAGTGASPLTGRRVTVKDNARNPARRSLTVVSSDPGITLGGGNGSADDPTTAGGSLRIVCGAGTCDETHPLAATGWAKLGKGANKGYRYRDPAGAAGPVRLVMLKAGHGRLLKIVARGAGLSTSLATDPQSIDVVLTTGGKRYCLQFDGAPRFRTSRLFTATGLAAPGTCP